MTEIIFNTSFSEYAVYRKNEFSSFERLTMENNKTETTAHSEKFIDFLLFMLRVSLGTIMITLSVRLITEGGWDTWMKLGGMLPKTVRGPFEQFFLQFWENPVILYLVIFASLAVGISMVLGIFTRLGALGGALMMIGFYLATIPPTFGWVNFHFIYFGAFVNFLVITPEFQFGLDHFLRRYKTRIKWLKWMVG
jgi:uncharacterized membrane protein YphA (DoxX/SURF4 family)